MTDESIPGGWGGKKGEGGGRVVEPVVPPKYLGGGGTYTDPQGRPISQEQAQQLGIVDKPGEFERKAQSIGVSPQEIYRQAIQQGKTPGEAAGYVRDLSLSVMQQRIIRRDPNISISPEIRQSRDIYNFLQASKGGGIHFAPGAESKAQRLSSKLGSVPEYRKVTYEPVKQSNAAETYFSQLAAKRLGIPTYDPLKQIHEAQRKKFEQDIFSRPSIYDMRGYEKRQYEKLSRAEKAGLLVTAGFAKPEIAAGYLEEKITGKPTYYQSDIYKYAMKDTKFVRILGTDFAVPQKRVLEDVGAGIFTTVAMGAAFKGAAYLASPAIKGSLGAGAKALGFTESKLGSFAARSSGIGTKTALQTSETLAGFGKEVLKLGARHPEAVIGGIVASAFVAEVARSQTKGEAAEKVIRAAATLPLMGEGYKGAERIGYAMPSASQFRGFVGSKASPVIAKYEPGAMARYDRTPAQFKKAVNTVKQLQLKRIKEQSGFERNKKPSGYEIMTPFARSVYDKFPTEQAKTILLESTKLAKASERLSKKSLREMAETTEGEFSFETTRDIGKRGKEIKEVLEQTPDSIVVGSLGSARFIKGFRGAEVELPTKNIHIPENAPPEVKAFMQKIVQSKVGDIELATDKPKRFEELKIEGLDIHGVKRGKHRFGEVGDPITNRFLQNVVNIVPARVMDPIKYKGVKYQNPVEQYWRKIEGSTKAMARNIEKFEGAAEKDIQQEFVKTSKGQRGDSIRRVKDVPDLVTTAEAFRDQILKDFPRETWVIQSARKVKEAEATKLYSGVPVEKYAYAFAKEYPKEIKTPPMLSGYGKVATEKQRYAALPKISKGSYPATVEGMVKAINGIYAPQKGPSQKYPPSSYPQKSNYQTLVNLYNNYPTKYQQPPKTQTPKPLVLRRISKDKFIPETAQGGKKSITLKFKDNIKHLERIHKKRGNFVWDINNPVPTLAALTGEAEPTRRKTTKRKTKRTKKSKR